MKKIVTYTALILISICLVILFYHYLKFLPKSTTLFDISIENLNSHGEVLTDQNGIQYIYASSENDMYLMQGYLHAQKRIVMMNQLLLAAQGRLSEKYGSRFIDHDFLLRSMNFYQHTSDEIAAMPESTQEKYRAYCDGINTFIKNNPLGATSLMRQDEPSPQIWEPEDCLAVSKLISWFFTDSWKKEIIRFKFSGLFDDSRTAEIFPNNKNIQSATLEQFEHLNQFWQQLCEIQEILKFKISGNNQSAILAISGDHLKNQNPVLLSSIQLTWNQEPVFIEMSLSNNQSQIAGLTLPGIPGVMIGSNGNIAWSLCNSLDDNVTIRKIRLYRQSNQILIDEQGYPVFSQPAQFQDSEGKITDRTVYYRNNEVLLMNFPIQKDTAEALVIRWSGFSSGNNFNNIFNINNTTDLTQLLNTIQPLSAPAINGCAIDKKGNLCGFSTSATENNCLNQQVMNPASGLIVATNSELMSKKFNTRFQRLYQDLENGYRLDEIDLKQLLGNHDIPSAEEMIPLYLKAVQNRQELTYLEQKALISLKSWNYEYSPESIGTTIYYFLINETISLIFQDEFDLCDHQAFNQFKKTPAFMHRTLAKVIKNGESPWYDNLQTTDQLERRNLILFKAFKNAVNRLATDYTENIREWEWQRISACCPATVFGQHRPKSSAIKALDILEYISNDKSGSIRYIIPFNEEILIQSCTIGKNNENSQCFKIHKNRMNVMAGTARVTVFTPVK